MRKSGRRLHVVGFADELAALREMYAHEKGLNLSPLRQIATAAREDGVFT